MAKRILVYVLSIFAILVSGCSIFSAASDEPDMRELREEWRLQWEPQESQLELAELPQEVTMALALLPQKRTASRAFQIHRNGEFCAYRIELADQSVLHYSSDGTVIEKPQLYNIHGGVI